MIESSGCGPAPARSRRGLPKGITGRLLLKNYLRLGDVCFRSRRVDA